MVFVSNGYTSEDLKEIRELHKEFVEKAKAGDWDYMAPYPPERLVTPFQRAADVLMAWKYDELKIVPLEYFEKHYEKGDDGYLDAFYDQDVLDARKKSQRIE